MKSPERGSAATKKAKAARDEKTGRFESSPLTDPYLLDQLIKVVRAVQDLEPMLAASVLAFKQLGDEESAAAASMVGGYLAELKRVSLEDLSTDPESLREVKKKRVEAKRLGSVTLAEQQRVQRQADDWKLHGVTPLSLAREHPNVLASAMLVAMQVGLRVQSEGAPLELPSEVVQLLAKPKDGDS